MKIKPSALKISPKQTVAFTFSESLSRIVLLFLFTNKAYISPISNKASRMLQGPLLTTGLNDSKNNAHKIVTKLLRMPMAKNRLLIIFLNLRIFFYSPNALIRGFQSWRGFCGFFAKAATGLKVPLDELVMCGLLNDHSI